MKNTNRLKHNKRKRNRRLRLVKRSIVFALLVICLIVSIFLGKKYLWDQNLGTKKNTKIDMTDTASGDTGDSEQALEDEAPKIQAPKLVKVPLQQVNKGMLILVNYEHAYAFEQDELLQLVQLTDENGFAFPVDEKDMQLSKEIIPALTQMLEACNQALGTSVTGIASAYRTKEYQQSIYDQYVQTNGQAYADAYVADPGYSEHHTGLAFDLGIYYADGSVGSFSKSDNAVWMNDHAYEYGFVRRYQENKIDITKINNEAWHFRYVGVPHATYMKQQDLALEEYIQYVREHTSKDVPLKIDTVQGSYEVYSEKRFEFEEPEGEYTISGDNIDGLIITLKR